MTSTTELWTLAHLWEVFRKGLVWILAASVLTGVTAFLISAQQTPQYRASTSLFVALSQGGSATDLAQGANFTTNQMESFGQLATSNRVLQPVIDELELEQTPRQLARSLSVSIPRDTVILNVSMLSADPEHAATVANTVAESLVSVIRDVVPRLPENDTPSITAEVVDTAVPPTVQASPNKTRDAALGLVAGSVLGTLGVFLRAMADTHIRTAEQLAAAASVPMLGRITRTRRGIEPSRAVRRDPLGRNAEEFRRVASALTYTGVNGPVRKVLLTSTTSGEGKTTFTANLAVTLAQLGHPVLTIDADLRRPRLAEYLGVDASVGLTDVLVGDVSLEDATVSHPENNLSVLPSGNVPPNSAELVTSDAMRELLTLVGESYRYVLVDSPPLLNVADASLLAPTVDGVVLVLDSRRTRRGPLRTSVANLEAAGGRILGVILNKTRPARGEGAYYGQTQSRRHRGS